ncbi:BatA domain-containing protein [Schlesneria paludicola]|uniref:BatA domain-containing protein n=1 Tax=Schlesneria paludicola TaxID=360056 RepID=UPI00029A5904|nr:BatA domain-containing protein [Schlesneria paludicola]
MSFLNAAFLWGLPLLAVPVAIHLLSRRRQEVVRWGAMQFLMDSSIRRRKIWRLDDLILMLLRTLAVLGIVLALSRPLWLGAGIGNGLGRDVIFVWDVSLSMQREDESGRSSFDKLLEKTKDLMGHVAAGDTIRGMVTIGRGRWLTSEPSSATAEQKSYLLDQLRAIGATQGAADWLACLGTAFRVSPPPRAKARLILVVTDGQTHGWRPQDQGEWAQIEQLVEESRIPMAVEMHNVIGVAAASHNLAVDSLTTPRQLVGAGETFLVEAMIRNHGHTPVQQLTVDWSLDDVAVGRSSIESLNAGQSAQVTLKPSAGHSGIRRLKCRIDVRDDLKADNEQIVIIETIDQVPLLLVDDSTSDDPLTSDKGYLLAALGQDPDGDNTTKSASVFRARTISPEELAGQSLADFRAVIFANTTNIDEAALAKLTEFVRAGGGLWLALGDRTPPHDFNRTFYRSGGGLSPWSIESPVGDLVRREEYLTIHPPDRDHPATVLLSDTQRLDIDRVKVFQRFPFDADPARMNVPVLLRSGTGQPLAIEGFLGRGRVIVQALSMGVRWSNLPLTQAYVPMVHEWLWYLVQPTAISRNLLPGDPLQVSLPTNEHVREVRLNRPNQNPVIMTVATRGDQAIAISRDTELPGAYDVVVASEGKEDAVQPYQVARVSGESNLDQWPESLSTKWRKMSAFRLDPDHPLAMPTGTAVEDRGNPLSPSILGLVVLAILAELWLVRFIARNRFGGDTGHDRLLASRLVGRVVSVRGNN